MRRLIKSNLIKSKIPNKPGVYTLYNKNKTPIYTGSSKILRHRLQSYLQKDNFREHPTKRILRQRAKYFSIKKIAITKARKIEKKRKIGFKFNFL